MGQGDETPGGSRSSRNAAAVAAAHLARDRGESTESDIAPRRLFADGSTAAAAVAAAASTGDDGDDDHNHDGRGGEKEAGRGVAADEEQGDDSGGGGSMRQTRQQQPASLSWKYAALGGVFFLRFLCPALTTPETYGLLGRTPRPHERRSLVLVTKLLQNLASGVLFGAKEPYMTAANAFVVDNLEVLTGFYRRLSEVPAIALTDHETMEHVVSADMDAFVPLVVSGSRTEEVDTQLSIVEALVGAHASEIVDALPPEQVGLRVYMESSFGAQFFRDDEEPFSTDF